MEQVIDISNLTVSFQDNGNLLTAIEDIQLGIRTGETLVVIGESGSGKSVLGLSILRLLPDTALISGSILFKGKKLLTMSESEIESIRGSMIAWIPQNPKTGFNPSMKMWKQIAEPSVIHSGLSWSEARKQAIQQLGLYNIDPAALWADKYPVTYSGGMLQRAMVDMGTSTNPEVIIADEPTKGIDIINKIAIFEMFADLKRKGITLVLITHDLDLAAELADRIVVMYCGQIIEVSGKNQFFHNPRHPYSRGLINSLPQNGLNPIPGSAPPMQMRLTGCRFRERCFEQREQCTSNIPLISLVDDRVRCIQYNSRNQAG